MTAGLTWRIGITRGHSMTGKTSHFKSFEELTKFGAVQNRFPDGGLRQSLPVPARRQGQLQVAFMFYACPIRPGATQIWPPTEVAWFNPVSGKLIALIKVLPIDFGQTHSANEALDGARNKFPGMTTDSLMKLKQRLSTLYDTLFETWATNSSAWSRDTLKDQAHEFLQIFDKISDLPLRPYYNALGHDYFEWVRALAKK
jgi:hypothetical protein